LESAAFYEGQISDRGHTDARDPRFMDTERPLRKELRDALIAGGVTSLYTHQATAFDLADAGKDIVVTTGTSSGKTLCYGLPVLQRLLSEPAARAMLLFPTKALAQDQLGKLRRLAPRGMEVNTYDGDTPKHKRPTIRASSHIVLTNPDMLHVGILPNSSSWAKFLKSLRFIVVDEMHAYAGIFGSHVALVLRRLLRLCEYYGSKPQIIACSATIANGCELFTALTGRTPDVVDVDGSGTGARKLLIWNPPETGEGERRSPNSESSQMLAFFAVRGIRSIAFAKSRIVAELVLRYAREALRMVDPELQERLEAYRGGYTPEERRNIEKRLFGGELLGVSATDAMELGIDVGDLDVAIVNGYPGSISSLRQQTGRAGRGKRDGLAILIGHNNPLDQYFMRHPMHLLAGKAEEVRIHKRNRYILSEQLKCAAYERPLGVSDLAHFPEGSLEILETLEAEEVVTRRNGLWFLTSQDSPAADVDIRSEAGPTFVLMSPNGVLGTMEQWRAYSNAHDGAIYLHRGEQYLVEQLDIPAQTIHVRPCKVDYYTQALSETTVSETAHIESRNVGRGQIHLQGLRVTTEVTAYRKKSLANDAVMAVHELDLPSITFETVGLRIDVPPATYGQEGSHGVGGVHALEHVLLALAPTIAQCEPRDIGSTYYQIWPETGLPSIFVFDSAPGGIGLTQALFENAGVWLIRAAELVSGCKCSDGCPGCVLSARCPYGNDNVDKMEAVQVVRDFRL
jgi:DEAD/DEAH box helicase domain-containing protein